MICLYGKKICGGMVSGAAYVFNRKCGRENVHQAASVDEEQRRLGQAMASAREELIRLAAASAHRHGIRIGICGELASQPNLIEKWKELGIDYLSVSPAVLK